MTGGVSTECRIGESLLHLSTGELLAQDKGATDIQADEMEAVLVDVDSKSGNVLKRG